MSNNVIKSNAPKLVMLKNVNTAVACLTYPENGCAIAKCLQKVIPLQELENVKVTVHGVHDQSMVLRLALYAWDKPLCLSEESFTFQ